MNWKYYFLNRPPSIGTHPGGEVGREVWQPVRDIPGLKRHAHGWVTYPQRLTCDQVWRYELMPDDAREANDYTEWRDANNK